MVTTSASSKLDERALLAAFVVVGLAFVAATAYTQHAMARVDDASDDIAFNSAPSIEQLAAICTSVRHAEFLLGSVLSSEADDRTQLDAAIAELDKEARTYLSLPTSPGEQSYWRELNDAIEAFDTDVRLALADPRPGPASHHGAALPEVSRVADRVSRAAAEALEFNARNGRDLAVGIKQIRRKVEWVGYGLAASLAVLTLLAGVLVHREVHRRRALADERAAMQERRAAELQSFAGHVAHDILNPVSAKQLSLGLVTRAGLSEEKAHELVSRAQRNLQRMHTIVDGLLQFARAGARPAAGASTDVVRVLEDVTDGIRPAAERAGIELHVEATAPCRAACSAGVVTSVVSNLAHNAIKFMGDAPPRRITIRSIADDGAVRVEVEDSGPGVPEELAGRIFHPYVRGPTHGAEGLAWRRSSASANRTEAR